MSKTKLHQRRRNHLLYLVGTAFLIIALAFFNRYPLVYSDTGTYIRSAFTLHPPVDRPIGYSLIIRAVTWQSTLWTVVLFQKIPRTWTPRTGSCCTIRPLQARNYTGIGDGARCRTWCIMNARTWKAPGYPDALRKPAGGVNMACGLTAGPALPHGSPGWLRTPWPARI